MSAHCPHRSSAELADYRIAMSAPPGPFGTPEVVCQRCGAVVGDEGKHDEWHKRESA